ncbi:MAG: thiopurine S-methyltransferase, partial [Gammaproteobacteria bacterium]|nr:thiopurine S-methyltransferase [Gammaproteobacteria bacterium]
MKSEFWLERWRTGQTGWHQAEVNPLLVKHWPQLELPEDCPVFVPLCGKTQDMIWLRQQGHPVYGVEIAEAAVRGFFDENGIRFEVAENREGLPRFSGRGYRIYCGDYLEISAPQIGATQGTYDRGALIAFPPDKRLIYA